jgi:hypothetical protein
MYRERTLKVVLVVVGILFIAGEASLIRNGIALWASMLSPFSAMPSHQVRGRPLKMIRSIRHASGRAFLGTIHD